jgi:hypothetical protein
VSDVRVFLGGEGANELGSRWREPPYESDDEPGVLQALLSRVEETGWVVAGATTWKKLRKLRARGPTPPEERNVVALAYEAKRAGAEILAFLRDADGDRDRSSVIEQGVARAKEDYPLVDVIGGVPFPVLEAWILAMLGDHKTEGLGKTAAQTCLEKKGLAAKDTAAMVAVVARTDLDRLPKDAGSLIAWRDAARKALTPRIRAALAPMSS